jgi:hypothetical protein
MMRLEFINKVREKDILGKSILTNDGQVLLRAGVELNGNYIKKLKELGVLYIYVEDERLEDVEVEDEKLAQLKQFTIKSMSNILANIHDFNGKKLKDSLSDVEDMINYIVNKLPENCFELKKITLLCANDKLKERMLKDGRRRFTPFPYIAVLFPRHIAA